MTRQKGFTLIELMIVVAVVAVLAAIAMPQYTQYMMRGKITEAVSGLSGMKIKLEQYFQDNRAYTGACAGGTVAPVPTGDSAKYFDFTCALATTTFLVTATGKNAMNGFVYTIDQANARATTALPSDWSGSGSSCWVVKRDGTC